MSRLGRYSLIALGCIACLAALLIFWPSTRAPLPEPSQSRLITNARVIDVVAGSAGPPVSIEIRDGKIVAIGAGLKADDLRQFDAEGAYLLPAFWDMHVHTFQSSPQMHLPLWIANGVTNVRDMMDCPKEEDSLIACAGDKRRWNAEIAEGRLSAPRFVEVASYYLESPEITPAEAEELVETYSNRGLDAIKVYNRLSPGAYQAAARKALALDVRIVGHLPKAISLDAAIEAGQKSFEHAHVLAQQCSSQAQDWRDGKLDDLSATIRLETIIAGFDTARCDDLIARLAASGAWLVPTHVTREEDARAADPSFADDPRLEYLDPLSRFAWDDDLGGTRSAYPGQRGERALQAYFAHGLHLTGKAHAGGVNILVGTDTALGGFRYHDELSHLVAAGMTPAEVIRAATLDAARYVGAEKTSGTVAIGKRADLVLLGGNPLDCIANTRRIVAVVQGGRLYDRAKLDGLLDFAKDQAGTPHTMAKLLWAFVRSSVSSDL